MIRPVALLIRNLIVQVERNGDVATAGHVQQCVDAALDVIALCRVEPNALRQPQDNLKQLDQDGLAGFDGRALIGERTAEESSDDVDGACRHVVLQSGIRVIPVIGVRSTTHHVDKEAPLEQVPHMPRSVNLLNFHFRVDIAVIEEVNVDLLNFRYAVLVRDYRYNVVQRQQTLALDLRVHVLAHGTQGQKTDQFDVVLEISAVLETQILESSHHFDQLVERSLVVVEDEDVLSDVDQLLHHHVLTLAD